MAELDFTECDHAQCPARSSYHFVKGMLSLSFCTHHSLMLRDGLTKDAWDQISISARVPVTQNK